MAKTLQPLDRETTGLRLFHWFTLLGWILMGAGILVWAFVLAPTSASYFGQTAKAARDAAAAGSALQDQLVVLAAWPKLLLPLVFLGVASFMVGIAMEFAAIPGILERQAEGLSQAVSRLIEL